MTKPKASPRSSAKPVKKAQAKTPPSKSTSTRKLRQSNYRSFRLSKRIKSTKPKVTNAFGLFWLSLKTLAHHWKLFGGIMFVYFVLSIMLVKGVGGSVNVGELKDILTEIFQGEGGRIAAGLAVFGVLLGSANTPASAVAGTYQSMLIVIVSLVIIWALRQSLAGIVVSVKEAYYKAIYPLIPFVLVILVIGLQLLPLVVVNFLYNVVFAGGLAITLLEKALWILLMFLLVLWTLYMVTSSLFALYIVTLPDMKPLQALRSARELVRHRRWSIMRKILFLPLAFVVIGAVIMLPVILILAPIAEWALFMLTVVSLAVVHAYMYHLYRELLL